MAPSLGFLLPMGEICIEFLVPGSSLVQDGLLCSFREQSSKWETSLSLFVSQVNKIKIIKRGYSALKSYGELQRASPMRRT